MKRLARLSKVSMLTSMAAVVMVMLPSYAECPAVDPLDHTVLLPNPEDCSSFFSCSNGVKILMKCPDGLHFNYILWVCDWPQSAGCMSYGTPATQKKTKITKTYTTTALGWSFNLGANVWIFNGQATANWPPNSKEVEEKIETEYSCCIYGNTPYICLNIPCE